MFSLARLGSWRVIPFEDQEEQWAEFPGTVIELATKSAMKWFTLGKTGRISSLHESRDT